MRPVALLGLLFCGHAVINGVAARPTRLDERGLPDQAARVAEPIFESVTKPVQSNAAALGTHLVPPKATVLSPIPHLYVGPAGTVSPGAAMPAKPIDISSVFGNQEFRNFITKQLAKHAPAESPKGADVPISFEANEALRQKHKNDDEYAIKSYHVLASVLGGFMVVPVALYEHNLIMSAKSDRMNSELQRLQGANQRYKDALFAAVLQQQMKGNGAAHHKVPPPSPPTPAPSNSPPSPQPQRRDVVASEPSSSSRRDLALAEAHTLQRRMLGLNTVGRAAKAFFVDPFKGGIDLKQTPVWFNLWLSAMGLMGTVSATHTVLLTHERIRKLGRQVDEARRENAAWQSGRVPEGVTVPLFLGHLPKGVNLPASLSTPAESEAAKSLPLASPAGHGATSHASTSREQVTTKPENTPAGEPGSAAERVVQDMAPDVAKHDKRSVAAAVEEEPEKGQPREEPKPRLRRIRRHAAHGQIAAF